MSFMYYLQSLSSRIWIVLVKGPYLVGQAHKGAQLCLGLCSDSVHTHPLRNSLWSADHQVSFVGAIGQTKPWLR